jgi:hypothetical protein
MATRPKLAPVQLSDGASETADPFDPFDPAALRADTLADVEVEKMLTAVPVRKPARTDFFRVHPEWVFDTYVLEREDGMDRETYIVAPNLIDQLAPELQRVRLFTVINRRGVVSLWPAKLPREGSNTGRRWAETALQAAEQATKLWVRMQADKDLGGYQILRAKGDLGSPQWPDKSHRDLIEIAFRNNVIDSPDHVVIRELNGEL